MIGTFLEKLLQLDDHNLYRIIARHYLKILYFPHNIIIDFFEKFLCEAKF